MTLTLSRRMDIVEPKMAALESLPGRMTGLESQFLQLREEMRAEFSGIRQELQAGDEETRRVLFEEISGLRQEMLAGDEETRRVLREEIAGLGTHMRVLHEALVDQIKLVQEGRPDRRRSRR